MDKIEAIKESISHWERMIEWVKTQDLNETPTLTKMEEEIQEGWKTNNCSLCQEYYNPFRGGVMICLGCPLALKYGNCSYHFTKNNWLAVNLSINWSEWLINAEKLLEQLRSLL